VSGLFFNVLFSVLADKVKNFQAVQHRDGSIDLNVVPYTAFDATVIESVRRNCDKFLKGVDVRTHIVPEIPTGSNGKMRVVVVER
jgi:hypothetical protein